MNNHDDIQYAEDVQKLQRKLSSGQLTQQQYEEEYENLRSSWVVNNTKHKVFDFLDGKNIQWKGKGKMF